jgi:hypothetical protein
MDPVDGLVFVPDMPDLNHAPSLYDGGQLQLPAAAHPTLPAAA